MGVKAAELYIKVKGGHFEHIMETKPIIIANINCFQSTFKVCLLKEFSKVAMTNPCKSKFNRVTIFL